MIILTVMRKRVNSYLIYCLQKLRIILQDQSLLIQAVLARSVLVDETDQNLLGKLSTAYESGIQVWAAAWGSGGVDPDMFQIWYSDRR